MVLRSKSVLLVFTSLLVLVFSVGLVSAPACTSDSDCSSGTCSGCTLTSWTCNGAFCESTTSSCPAGTHCSGGSCVSATEVCNEVDDDCDGDIDAADSDIDCCSNADCASGYYCSGTSCVSCDADGDGYDRYSCGGSDCHDGRADTHPGATEVCDGVDNDCDGSTDEGVGFCADTSSGSSCNGLISCGSYSESNCPSSCTLTDGVCKILGTGHGQSIDDAQCPPGASVTGLNEFYCRSDCPSPCLCDWVDYDPDVCTGAPSCTMSDCTNDPITNGCSLYVPDGGCSGLSYSACNADADCGWDCCDFVTCYADTDGDGYGSSTSQQSNCDGSCPDGYVTMTNDCLDSDGSVYPGQTQVTTCSVGVCSGTKYRVCNPDGSFSSWSTCDNLDYSGTNYESSESSCDGFDNDCDGTVDDFTLVVSCSNTNSYGTCTGSRTDTCSSSGSWSYGTCSADTPAKEVCDGVDNDCDGVVDEGLTTTSGCSQHGICAGAIRSCVSGSMTSCSVLPETEVCDGVDNDCDGLVDENVGDCWVADNYNCEGSVDCSSYDAGSCPLSYGCSISPGYCNVTGTFCDVAGDCPVGESCDGAECAGSPSCAQFIDDGYCTATVGCSWWSGVDSYGSKTTCDGNGVWLCDAGSEEICSDGIDNDGDDLIDCMDSDCQVSATGTTDISSLICLGTDTYKETDDLTGDVNGDGNPIEWQCGQGVDALTNTVVSDVGLCCQEGQYPRKSASGVWSCQSSNICLAPAGDCGSEYDSAFASWLTDLDCVNPSAQTACCNVVQFGSLEYWSDTDNVKVY